MKASDIEKKYTIRELACDDWPEIEQLFGTTGACGGCWCMYWRLPMGGKLWEEQKGSGNRIAFKNLVTAGKVRGILAFHDKKPVGWCSFGPRLDFPRTERAKAYALAQGDTLEEIWSINCFFITREHRNSGLTACLAAHAIRSMRAEGVKLAEAYPVTLSRNGQKLPAAFSFTGPDVVFEKLGFVRIRAVSPSRPLYRMKL